MPNIIPKILIDMDSLGYNSVQNVLKFIEY